MLGGDPTEPMVHLVGNTNVCTYLKSERRLWLPDGVLGVGGGVGVGVIPAAAGWRLSPMPRQVRELLGGLANERLEQRTNGLLKIG
jgi:hypothetical protein